jgi:predicted type IV restriction endonuclease
LAILTDGQEWNFFLPAGQGDYGERRVYKLDIVERELAESVTRLTRYLSYAEITSGRAIESAQQDYLNVSKGRQMRATLPAAWSKLVAEEDELLLELIADQVESLCGFKPDLDTVARFLTESVSLRSVAASPSQRQIPHSTAKQIASAPMVPQTARPAPSNPHGAIGFSLDGHFTVCRNGRDLLVHAFEALSVRDATFLDRFAARPKHGRTRRYLARTPEELYPGRPDLAREHSARLKSGWFIGTNVSKAQIERIVEMGCEVAHIRFGKDLIINVGE